MYSESIQSMMSSKMIFPFEEIGSELRSSKTHARDAALAKESGSDFGVKIISYAVKQVI